MFHKDDIFKAYKLSGNYENSFFTPYKSCFNKTALDDLYLNVTAVFLKPLVDAAMVVTCASRSVNSFSCTVTNLIAGIVKLDSELLVLSLKSAKNTAINVVATVYFALSIVTDFIDSLVRLITHSMASAGSAVRDLMSNDEESSPISQSYN